MTMTTIAAKFTEELDAQLVNTLREIDPYNYAYLFERCKRCNVNARHLRFFKKDQLHELIPKSELGILAEFEYLLNLWQISKGNTSLNTKIQLNRDSESKNLNSPKEKPQAQSIINIANEKPHILSNNQPVVIAKQAFAIKPLPKNLQGDQISSSTMVVDDPDDLLIVLDSNENSQISDAKRMIFNEDDEEKFTLETIIPELFNELKDRYESKNSLSTKERRFLCSSIVDYFESRNTKFSSNIMDELAEQIVEHFPTEDKKTWCNRDGLRTCGRFLSHLHYSRSKMAKQTSTNFTSRENEDDEEKFTLETIIPELLKELKDSYESKNSLSTNERRLLCSSIVDYFVSRKIKFSSDIMDELAEQIVEHFPTEDKKSWCNRDGVRTCGRFRIRLYNARRYMAKQTSTNFTSRENKDDEEKFTLETIIPELLKELKDSYESKNSLSRKERRLLCSAIVDYFVSRKIKFGSYIMDELAEQIVEHFPTEDKKSWCNRDGPGTRGRLIFRLYRPRSRNMAKQTNNTSTSKVTLEIIIPELLKELKYSYESKNSLSRKERRLLCTAIVDYFESKKIKFSSYTMDDLAAQIVEHFPTEDKKSWCNRNGHDTRGRLVLSLRKSRRNMAKQTNNTSTSKVATNSASSKDEKSKISKAKHMKFDDDDDEEHFTLETIIPELLKELKDSYESKDSLSINERRLLCSSIVDYFNSRNIKFSSDRMAELAEQIVEHFPKEDKKTWYSREGYITRGRLFIRLRTSRRNMAKQTNNRSTSNVVTNSASSEDEDDEEQFTLETIIPELLKELKDSYESKNSLSRKERRLLCSAIVDYFVSRKIKFGSYIMDELAEQIVEHFPTEDKKSWCNRDGPGTRGRLIFRLYRPRSRNMAKQTNNTSTSKVTLEIIIPELLKELKYSYESKNSLSRKERRLLCTAIVDYFESKKIKFSSYTMDDLAAQIVEHFPTEDKKSWCNRNGHDTRGRLVLSLRKSRRNMAKQTNNTSTSKVATNSASSKDEKSKISKAKHMKFDDDDDEEHFTLETIIPELLKELKDSYESKDSLSINERRLLCSSIVDYFNSRNIKFSSDRMAELAEQIVEHFPKEDKKTWYSREGYITRGRLFIRLRTSRRNMAKQTNNRSTSNVVTNSASSEDEDDEEKFTLETIIPELLKELKDSYESKNSLSKNERHFLCSSIVDCFVSRKIKFSSDIMDKLAEQIVEHFPTEDKKSWCNRDGYRTCGRFYYRLIYVRRNILKQTNNTSTTKLDTNSTSREPESREEVHYEDRKSIQAWLKSHKCENFSEIIDMWEDTMKYRCSQTQNLKDLKSILEFLNNWPSYKLETGHELLNMDFQYLYPEAIETYRTRWLVYKQNIEQFLKVELKDVNCIKLLETYQLQKAKATINEDSSSCILIYLVHAITKPLGHFEAVNGNVSYAITDSQHSMMRLIRHKAEIDEYTEPYPCIFVVADSMLEVQECYVVFMDLHYKLNYENCLSVCVQIFTVLNMEDPPASQCFWEFIRGYMFNIAKDKGEFNLATENMVNYLETVASSV